MAFGASLRYKENSIIILRIQARMGLLALSNIGVTHEQGYPFRQTGAR